MMQMTAGAMTLSDLILLYAIRRAVACAFKSPVLRSQLYHRQAIFADLYKLPSVQVCYARQDPAPKDIFAWHLMHAMLESWPARFVSNLGHAHLLPDESSPAARQSQDQ